MSSAFLNGNFVGEIYYYCEHEVDLLPKLMYINFTSCYILPIMSFVGFTLKMLSLAILQQSGFHKPCNILLFGLVVGDSMCLLGFMNFGEILHYYGPNKPYPNKCGFQYEMSLNVFLFSVYELFQFSGNWGMYVNTLVPVFITLERILAVFMPLTFKTIMTKKTAIAVILLSFVFWLPWALVLSAMTYLLAKPLQLNVTGVYMGSIVSRYPVVRFMETYVIDALASWFPLTVIIIGCSAVGFKVNLALKRRRTLTSAEKLTWSPRTTATLLLTCVIFATTHGAGSMLMYLMPLDNGFTFLFRNYTLSILYAINASSNFFVYISSNQKLYVIFKDLMGRKIITLKA